ncbi:MAG TPA: hypothetical protein VGB87_13920 [Vicinamibacteria bacterium]
MATIGDSPGCLVPPRDDIPGEDGWIGVSPVEGAIGSDTISHLADVAIRLGRPLLWDPVKERVVGEANGRLERPVRTPWKM